MSPVKDGMSVENILHLVLNPVRDDMLVTADDGRTGYGVSSLTRTSRNQTAWKAGFS
jgi:hypothetical protein